MKKIFFKTIIIVLFLFVSINIIETYSHNQDEYGVDYFSNVKKSIEDYQLVYKIVFMETMQLENKEYTRFIDIYAGAYLDDYGFLNVLFIDDADNISLIENTKKQILASTHNDSIKYESASYSDNHLQDILNCIEPIMLKFDIMAVGIDDKLNKVFVELSTNHKYDIENYLMEIGCFEDSILFYYSETTNITANSCVSHGGESIYYYNDDDYDSTSPKEIIIVIDSKEKHDQIFDCEHDVDYDNEILILRLFADTSCSYWLHDVILETGILKVVFYYKINSSTEPVRQFHIIKMDKIEYETIEFISKRVKQ